MKVTLIRPPDTSLGEFKKVGGVQHPINLVYLATYLLKNNGVEAEVIDLEVEDIRNLYTRMRESMAVGITAMTPNMPLVNKIASMAKKAGAKVILGGVHPTVMPEESLCETKADVVVRGEGEKTLMNVVKCLKTNSNLRDVRGISYRSKNGIIHNAPCGYIEDLDSLPIPDRTLLKLEKYKGEVSPGIPKKSTVMFTSRGCPYNCTFCSARYIQGKRVRMRSVENLMKEVELINELGFEHITIDDDTFTLNKQRVMDFCDALMRDYSHLTFDCDTRVNTVDKEMLVKMKKAGCIKIGYGFESGSPKVLKDMRKRITVDQIKDAFKLTKGVGIKTQAYIMVGYPTETPEDVELTLKLIKRVDPELIHVSITTPYPGTELFRIYKEKGYLKEVNWGDFYLFPRKIPWRTDSFTGEELINLRDKILREFYLSPGYIAKRISEIRSWDDFKYYLKSGATILKFLGS